jgi:hypothetical protein
MYFCISLALEEVLEEVSLMIRLSIGIEWEGQRRHLDEIQRKPRNKLKRYK